MNDVKVGFTYYDVDYVCDFTGVFLMALLSINGGIGLHMYIAQVNLKGGHGWCLMMCRFREVIVLLTGSSLDLGFLQDFVVCPQVPRTHIMTLMFLIL
uniref:Uncharacterized protein n=1 Tax=Solanum tuberosum TaxID=4113 RepID=M1DSH2_SOLTU